MRILQVSAELFPLLKTGGLADVTGALPTALQAAGHDVRALLPGFPAIVAGVRDSAPQAEFDTPWGERVRLQRGRIPGSAPGVPDLPTYWIDAPRLYDRPGNPYEDEHRQPYGDNHLRFALLGWAAARLAHGMDAKWQPQVVHAHDWHAALAPTYLACVPQPAGLPRAATVYTVHNLAYQGLFAPWHLQELGLPPAAFHMNGLEYHGQISFMKGGLCFADRITTVSPTYAREIQTPEQGFGLDGVLRSRAHVLSGILNGVDDRVWNPATDTLLGARFDRKKMPGKARCKAALQAELGLTEQADAPLFILVSRLTEQKGLPLVLEGLDAIVGQGGQLALLGSGDGWLEAAFRERAAASPAQVSVTLGYSEALAHRLFGGGDVTLVPSLFEPCGLTQMYGLKYGSLPLVHRVGGLADTVVDSSLENIADGTATGFVFDRFDGEAFARAVRRAIALFRRPTDWRAVRAAAMNRPADWGLAANQYVSVYEQALAA
ncbi:glycogen synthase GlgA [Variovorax dokdonensis]|uniref:Glycogen synthase n=1 Tax=Variovorax dokdonensis TaxID=344883 RepID=A0ABT7NA81_9BURK|nr:glycogen synthase GlgA [Variovorax dokdonensis]MDM0044848.1 glycogen synthase GlgA [Variovorax dokdonensis]